MGRIMPVGVLAALVGGGVSLGLATPAHALTDSELKCQDAIAIAARNYFKQQYTVVSKCEDKRSAGAVDITTECRPRKCVGGDNDGLACASALDCPGGSCDTNPNLDAKSADKLGKVAAKVEPKIESKCGATVPSAVVLGLPCGTTAALTASDVAACIVTQAHGVDAERLITTVYDETGAITDPGVLACQKTIAKESRNFVKKRATRKRNCAKKLAAGKIAGPCPDAKTKKALDKDLAKYQDKVLAACSATQVLDPSKDFGFPCEREGATTFAKLTFDRNDPTLTADKKLFRCLAVAAAADADAGAETVYPMPDAAPFSYGVAAGDPTDSAFIAWTRVDNGAAVSLEVSTSEDFSSIVATQTNLLPDALADNTVKTEVTGLTPATDYYYHFVQGAESSRIGHLRTALLPSSSAPVKFVWTGDANAFFKPFTVLDPILADDPDLWLFIGDTIYGDDARSGSGVAVTRTDYHNKYKENRSDASLRNVMARIGTVSIWDDHEVTNDFYGTNPSPAFQTQMAAGNQAYRDYTPLRENLGDPMQLYRSFQWGQAAEFFLIDDRQYRSPQAYITEPACLSGGDPIVLPPAGACATEIANPARTYLGATQKQWLEDGLLNSTATFKFVMNGPLLSSLVFLPYDRWEGYAAEQQEIINFIKSNNIKNVIFLSTDIHGLIVNDQVGNATPPIIRELVSGAIGMDSIYRELPSSISSLVPTLPTLFPTISYFDIDRFNYGLIEASTTEATVTYRDVTGAVLKQFTIPAS
jgi:phosphodiesterase/alkaline phosphatase D-like protein